MSASRRIAYFCMEFGLDPSLTIYSGGLGILAGDHMKSVGDLKIPLVGIGLLWDEGYTRQVLGPDDTIVDEYPKTSRSALTKVDVEFEVTVRGKTVRCTAWRVNRFTSAELYLIEPSNESDRWITQRLYGGNSEDRLAQEILLGVGGVRLLRSLGKDVDVYHWNEGHAVLAGLELLRENRYGGTTLAERMTALRKHVVFTTHTPVAAGNEIHDLALMRKMDADVGFTDAELLEIGGSENGVSQRTLENGAQFSMTVAGLRLSRIANGVAQLHGETARTMWKDVSGAAPIISITNGVHTGTWQDARIRAALAIGKSKEVQDTQLLAAHSKMKQELREEVRKRTGATIYEDGLLIGFARRAATYKRADLILSDESVFSDLFANNCIQIIYSGKAHPRDSAGKAIVSRLVAASRKHPGSIIFLQNYDMRTGALLTRGCDIWLNNPRRPLEASGTSGMKAAMNGVPNLSILDGWWPEGCEHGVTGWRIGEVDASDNAFDDADAQRIDQRDQRNLLAVLADEVLPVFRDRSRWVDVMRASIEMSQWRFSSDRMVEEYAERVYGL